jgi:signal transduction histidine kinase
LVTILNVNDREVARYVITHMLGRAGFAVVEAATGPQALEKVAEQAPDLIVLDVKLPGFSGIEVCRRLKGHPATAGIPVLLSSATFTSSGSRVEGLESGADAYLAQPYEASELIATVRALLRMKRAEHEAQQAVRLRDDFLSVASHELKTPLTALSLRLQANLRRLKALGEGQVPAPQMVGLLGSLSEQTHKLAVLMEGLLDVSRIAQGRLQLDFEQLDLAQLVRSVASRFEAQAAEAGSPLLVRAEERVEGTWDRLRLEQVVTNLLSNALKYGAGRPVELALLADAEQVHLTVRDEGIGIATEALDRIFERFERAVSGRNYSGLGLGLYITRQIVESLGGQVSAQSVPGQGSTFTVRLPRARAAASPAPAEGPSSAQVG